MTYPTGFDTSKDDSESDEYNVKMVTQKLLSRRIFTGIYLERRWVQAVNNYRDVIVINKTGNEDFITDLNYSMKRLKEFYGDQKWIGFTGPNCIGAPSGYCLWVKTLNMPLGQHEFTTKHVKYTDDEVYSSVKSLRHIDISTEPSTDENNDTPFHISDALSDKCDQLSQLFQRTFDLLTLDTAKTAASLIIVMIIGLLDVVKYIGDFLNKIVGAIFVLIAMFFRQLFQYRRDIPYNRMPTEYHPDTRYWGPNNMHYYQRRPSRGY